MRIEFGVHWIEVDRDGLSSNLKDDRDDYDYREYNSAIDGMESLLLNLVSVGLINENTRMDDLSDACALTVEAIANNTI